MREGGSGAGGRRRRRRALGCWFLGFLAFLGFLGLPGDLAGAARAPRVPSPTVAGGASSASIPPAPTLPASTLPTSTLPTLILEVREERPGELAGVAERVRAFDRRRLSVAMDLAGLSDPGPPILLILVAEDHAVARQTPPWISGYARGYRSLAVVFPQRIPNYPDKSLEAVIQHEVAHVLIHRASRGRGVPRWFNEGVAMAAGRAWTLEDRGRLTWGVLTGGPRGFLDLENAFGRGAGSAATAYALSSAVVRELRDDAGPAATGDILRRVGTGESFEEAFAAVVGRSLADFERSFFRGQTFWNRWVPFLSSSAVLWIGITFLFLAAYRRRRQRDAALAARWELEEQAQTLVRLRVVRGGGGGRDAEDGDPGDDGDEDGDEDGDPRDDGEWVN